METASLVAFRVFNNVKSLVLYLDQQRGQNERKNPTSSTSHFIEATSNPSSPISHLAYPEATSPTVPLTNSLLSNPSDATMFG